MKKGIKYLAIVFTILLTACSGGGYETGSEDTEEAEVVEPEIVGEEVSYSTDSVTMTGYIVYDKNSTEKVPGILVVHEWWGHNDYARKRAEMLGELGYVALAVDMYGDGKLATHPGEAQEFMMAVVSNLDVAKLRFEKALETLKANPNVDPEKIAAIGYCFGGTVSLSMANAGYDLDAVAAFHSGVGLPFPPTEDLATRVLVCNGADDPFIPAAQVEAFKAKMDSVGANYEYVSYPGAVHSFTNPEADANAEKFQNPAWAYNEEADKDSWDKMKKMFEEVFK